MTLGFAPHRPLRLIKNCCVVSQSTIVTSRSLSIIWDWGTKQIFAKVQRKYVANRLPLWIVLFWRGVSTRKPDNSMDLLIRRGTNDETPWAISNTWVAAQSGVILQCGANKEQFSQRCTSVHFQQKCWCTKQQCATILFSRTAKCPRLRVGQFLTRVFTSKALFLYIAVLRCCISPDAARQSIFDTRVNAQSGNELWYCPHVLPINR